MDSPQPPRFPLRGEAARSLYSDVRVIVAGDATLSCHKAVLAAHSPVFHSLFESCAAAPGEAQATLRFEKHGTKAVDTFLEILYGRPPAALNLDEVEGVLALAHEFDAPEPPSILSSPSAFHLRFVLFREHFVAGSDNTRMHSLVRRVTREPLRDVALVKRADCEITGVEGED